MFECDSADMCAGKFPLVSMEARPEGLACADPGARTPTGASGNFIHLLSSFILLSYSRLDETETVSHLFYISCLLALPLL